MLDKIEANIGILKILISWGPEDMAYAKNINLANECLRGIQRVSGENDRVCTAISDLMVIIPKLEEGLNAELKRELLKAEKELMQRTKILNHAKKHNLRMVDVGVKTDITSEELKGFPVMTKEQWANKRKAMLTVVNILEEPAT